MPGYRGIPPADLELLRKFDTPTVCNVVELFDQRSRTAVEGRDDLVGRRTRHVLRRGQDLKLGH